MRPSALVTGATGCIGRQVIRKLLDNGWLVHAVSTRSPQLRTSNLVWHRANLLEPGAAQSTVESADHPDLLLHLAWYVAPGRWASDPSNVDWVAASVDLVRAFARAGGRRVVVAGSCLEYDWSFGYCSEARTPCRPHTLYGRSKHALHVLLEGLLGGGELSLAWARVFFLYGPYEHPDRVLPYVIRNLLSDKPALCSDGRQIRDYLFSVDVADALVGLAESDVTGVVNIGSGVPVVLRDLLGRVGDLLGRRELIRFGEIAQASTDMPLVVADVGRLGEVLGWQPEHTLDDGLAHTIEWWRRASNLEEVG